MQLTKLAVGSHVFSHHTHSPSTMCGHVRRGMGAGGWKPDDTLPTVKAPLASVEGWRLPRGLKTVFVGAQRLGLPRPGMFQGTDQFAYRLGALSGCRNG